jgi:hypothetical protein
MLSKQPKRSQEAITSSGDFPPPSARTVSLNRLPVSSIAYKTGIRNIIIYIDAIGKWDKGNVDPASSNIETVLIFFFLVKSIPSHYPNQRLQKLRMHQLTVLQPTESRT